MYQSRTADQPPLTLHSLAHARVLDRVLGSAIPGLCDFAMVHVRTKQAVIGIKAVHDRREHTRTLRELLRVHRLRASDPDSTVAQVIRTGRPLVRPDIRPEPRPATDRPRDGRVAELHRRLAIRSALVVPIMVREIVLGALSLCFSHSGRRYATRDIAPAEMLAVRLGYVLMMTANPQGALRLPMAAGGLRAGTTIRRRAGSRNSS